METESRYSELLSKSDNGLLYDGPNARKYKGKYIIVEDDDTCFINEDEVDEFIQLRTKKANEFMNSLGTSTDTDDLFNDYDD